MDLSEGRTLKIPTRVDGTRGRTYNVPKYWTFRAMSVPRHGELRWSGTKYYLRSGADVAICRSIWSTSMIAIVRARNRRRAAKNSMPLVSVSVHRSKSLKCHRSAVLSPSLPKLRPRLCQEPLIASDLEMCCVKRQALSISTQWSKPTRHATSSALIVIAPPALASRRPAYADPISTACRQRCDVFA